MKQNRRLLFSVESIEFVSLLAVWAVIVIASLALAGWVLNIPTLKGLNPQWTAMRLITIICFFMSAAAMASMLKKTTIRWTIIISRVFAVGISLVGLLTLISYFVELKTGHAWSWALRPLLSSFLSSTTRMALITAMLFSIYGCVLLLLATGSRRAADIAHVMLLPMTLMTYLVLVGYLLHISSFYEWQHIGVALNTGVAFCALCVASFFARPDTWLMEVFTGDKSGAIMARRLLPALLILPLLIGWLRLHGERAGAFTSEVGVALVAVTYTVCFFSLIWLNAKFVNRTDQLRRNAEETLREREQQLRHALEAGGLGIWGLDTKTGQAWRSLHHDQIFGYETLLSEWTYQMFLAHVLSEDRKEVDQKFGHALATGAEWSFECRIRRADGVVRWIWAQGKPRTNDRDRNEIVQMVGLVRDITASKQAEEALKESENRFRAMFEQAAVGVALVNTKTGQFVRINQKYCDFVGYSMQEMLQKSFMDITYYQDIQTNDDANAQLIEGNKREFSFEKRYVHKNGKLIWGKLTISPLWKSDEKPQTYFHIAIVEDITERKRVETALRESEKLYRAIGESIDYGIWVCDSKGRNIYASESFFKLVGLTQEQCSNFGWGDVLHPDDADRTIAAWKECVRTGSIWDIEHRFRGVDGQWYFILARGVPVRDEKGEIIRWVGINLDINKLKKVELELQERTQQMEAALKELESFSYSVSHDLRAPLRAIDGYSRMFLKKYGDMLGEDAARILHVICSNTEMMALLIDSLLSFSRLQQTRMSLSEIDMDKLVSEVWQDIRAANQERELEVKGAKLLPGFGDKLLIRQVLYNLFSNAVKFTKNRTPGTIEMSSYAEPGRVVYCLKDNGVGFDMAYYEKLFGVFQRLHDYAEYEGTGIGLAIVQRIVKRHGGQVWAEGRVDEGATFYFTLPRE